jgi:mannose-6-phosphate isomerase-like protein (cupin superfamily)
MDQKGKYLVKLEDGRNEPIKGLQNALRIVLVDKDTVGAEDITFLYFKLEAKVLPEKKHVHRNAEEVMYTLSGKGIACVGQQEFEVVKGDTVWVPRGEVHRVANPSDEPLEMIVIYTCPSLQSAGGYEIVA